MYQKHQTTRLSVRLSLREPFTVLTEYRNRDGPLIYHQRDGPQWYRFIGVDRGATGPPADHCRWLTEFLNILNNFYFFNLEQIMNTKRFIQIGLVLLGMLGFQQVSYAVGTDAGTNITNSATLSFDVGGVGQTPIVSNITDFEVDQLVNFQILEAGDDIHTGLPSASAVARFTLSHDGNETQRFALSAVNLADGQTIDIDGGGPLAPYVDSLTTAGTDVSALAIYADDGDGLFEPGVGAGLDGAAVTFVELADAAGTVNQTIWVQATLPAGAPDGENALISLTVTAQEATTGAVLVADIDGDDPTLVEIVFADPAGTEAGDAASDGVHSDRDVFQVQSSQIGVAKTVTTIWDPINAGVGVIATNDPLAVPGAYVRYAITIENLDAAGAAATLTTVSDTLAAVSAFDSEYIIDNCADTGSAATCATESTLVGRGISVTTGTNACSAPNLANARAAATTYYTTATADDAAEHDGSPTGGAVSVTLNAAAGPLPSDATHPNAGDLLPCETVTIEFNAIVQ